MERMAVDRTIRQLYIHYGISVSSSQFWSLAAGIRTYKWHDEQEWVRIPKY